MSPFAIYLKQLRIGRGYRQKELAHKLGYEPSYLSALERSEKGPPKEDFVTRLVRGLALTPDEEAELYRALLASRRQITLPNLAPEREYRLFRLMEPQLGRLQGYQLELIEYALRLPTALQSAAKV